MLCFIRFVRNDIAFQTMAVSGQNGILFVIKFITMTPNKF